MGICWNNSCFTFRPAMPMLSPLRLGVNLARRVRRAPAWETARRPERFESPRGAPTLSALSPPPHRLFQHAMENPVDRTIRLMSLAAGIVGLLVIVAFQFI
jgi:hypothetical protein